MNLNDEKLLAYLHDELIGKEKEDFEQLLNSNADLYNKYQSFLKVKENFGSYRNIESEVSFSRPVLVNDNKKKKSLFDVIFHTPAYLYSTAATLLLLILVLTFIPRFAKPNKELSKITSELKDNEAAEVLKNYNIDNSSLSDNEAIPDSAVTDFYTEEASTETEAINNYISSSDYYPSASKSLYTNLSDEDADQIYNELINKKIVE